MLYSDSCHWSLLQQAKMLNTLVPFVKSNCIVELLLITNKPSVLLLKIHSIGELTGINRSEALSTIEAKSPVSDTIITT